VFYNTINLKGKYLDRAMSQAKTQKSKILVYFRRRPGMKCTPFEVLQFFNAIGYDWPITSVRRAMTDLTADGLLVKTSLKSDERLGKPNHCWTLADVEHKQLNLFERRC
jgi:hypothetical protein